MSAPEIEASYPLSPLQEGMLFHALMAKESGAYIPQTLIEIREKLDPQKFRLAWQALAERHPILRTSFRWDGSPDLAQDVHKNVEFPWEFQDWREMPASEQKDRLNDFLKADRRRGFDMRKAPLMRVAVFQKADQDFIVVWTCHHAIFDGRSRFHATRELFECYEALVEGRKPELSPVLPYQLFIDWLKQQDPVRAKAYWSGILKDFSAPTPLGLDHSPIPGNGERARRGEKSLRLPAEMTSALRKFASDQQVALSTLFHGAWALCLSRYSNEADVVFGVTRAGRSKSIEHVDSILGLFINTVPERVRISPDLTCAAWLRDLRASQKQVREFEHTSLVEIQKCTAIPANRPLFESILVLEHASLDATVRKLGGKWENRRFKILDQTTYPLSVFAYLEDELLMGIAFDRTRFDEADIERMLGHLRTALESMMAAPNGRVAELPILTAAERNQLLVEWNNTAVDHPKDRCIHQLIEEQAAKTPEAIAVSFDGARLTYRELNERANALAHELQKRGVRPETLVGICVERSFEMVVGILGILKAGGAYVPLDPSYPNERLKFMLEDANVALLLTQSRHLQAMTGVKVGTLCLDTEWDTVAQQSKENPPGRATPENLAYLIYTSGSTGRPKAVMIPHKAIVNHMFWLQRVYPLSAGDSVLQKTPFSFDASVWEFYAPLMVGGRLIMARPQGHLDSAYMSRTIREHGVTTLQLVPSMLRMLLDEPDFARCISLRRVFCGGEALTPDLQEKFFASLPQSTLHNLYGPAEAAIDSTSWNCERSVTGATVPIGRPIDNAVAYVVDANLNPVPFGVPGELLIGGAGLAHGYLNLPELTAEKFIADPFSQKPDGRVYRTGDLARYRDDGNLEFLGRVDDQVKIRGFRIELGEIESVLAGHPDVLETAAAAHADNGYSSRLVAYFVPRSKVPPSIDALKQFLRQRLPEYMVPPHFIMLQKLPVTPNGKIDRGALPDVEGNRDHLETPYVAPSDDVERRLAVIWSEVLGVPKVGINDNFFEVGGHSLLAVRLVARIQKDFRQDITLAVIFEAPTIAELAGILREKETRSESIAPVRRLPRRTEFKKVGHG